MATGTTPTPKGIKSTAITQPMADGTNHGVVLNQLKEVAEIGQRLRGDPRDSFVRVSELETALKVRLVNGTLQPPLTSSSSGSGTVNVLDSVVGDGSSGTPLKLDGDTASPGNNKVYGTNGSGVKGWYAAGGGGGGSLTVTDGTHTVASTTQITFTGATVGGSTPNATVTISGGGSTPVPLSIPNCQYWWDASLCDGQPGDLVTTLQNQQPLLSAMSGFNNSQMPNISSAQLNGLNTLDFNSNNQILFPGATNSAGPFLAKSTIFVIFNLANAGSVDALVSGTSSALSLFQNGPNLALSRAFVAVIATDTTALVANTWYQANVTYDSVSGAYAFRIARAASSSGSNALPITAPSSGLFFTPGAGQQFGGKAAEMIIYNRVLSGAEITTIENYLHAKWNV